MKRLGYTQEQITFVGDNNIYNYQGVGCPHLHADFKKVYMCVFVCGCMYVC